MTIEAVGLITYDHPHLKTAQVLERLAERGWELTIYALPFTPRKPRRTLFDHRPDQTGAVHPRTLAERYGIAWRPCARDADIDGRCDLYLVLGAGILSPQCVADKRILNCHPGVIPASRGLDSFKWTIHDMKPLGVTLHWIDQRVDAGEIVAVLPTRVDPGDSPEALARRHYRSEIDCLARFDEFLDNPRNPFAGIAEGEARRRMPPETEEEFLRRFPDYLRRYGR